MQRLQEPQSSFSGCHCCVGCPWHHVLPRWSSHWHPTIAHYNGTLQWHIAMAPRPMAPRPPSQSWPSPSPPTIAHYNGTLQPRPLLQSWSSPSAPTIAHYNTTMHPAIWHPAMAPRPLPQNWSAPSPPTIAHYNGTLQWHHDHSPKVSRHPHSPKVGRHLPPNHSTLQSTPAKLVVTLPPNHRTPQP